MYPLDERLAREIKIEQGLVTKKTREEYLLAHLGLPVRHPRRQRPLEKEPPETTEVPLRVSSPKETAAVARADVASRCSSVGASRPRTSASALRQEGRRLPSRAGTAPAPADGRSEAGATVAAERPRGPRPRSTAPIFSDTSQDPVMAALLYGPPLFSPELCRCASFSLLARPQGSAMQPSRR
mmetsp:Transcript_36527/g.66950  ORF Transcript_36527/g.66950 Transcript_36527/m.66950 type:complete len:183 (+) Transcript_36527:48-596(+)